MLLSGEGTLRDVIFEVLRSKPILVPSGVRLPRRCFYPRALARVAGLTDVIYEVLRSKPNLGGAVCRGSGQKYWRPKETQAQRRE
jgi:hypothetical protein